MLLYKIPPVLLNTLSIENLAQVHSAKLVPKENL